MTPNENTNKAARISRIRQKAGKRAAANRKVKRGFERTGFTMDKGKFLWSAGLGRTSVDPAQ